VVVAAVDVAVEVVGAGSSFVLVVVRSTVLVLVLVLMLVVVESLPHADSATANAPTTASEIKLAAIRRIEPSSNGARRILTATTNRGKRPLRFGGNADQVGVISATGSARPAERRSVAIRRPG
jgi:hypothetical protein